MKLYADEFYAILPLQGLTDRTLDIGLAGIAFGAVGAAIAGAERNAHDVWYAARIDPEFRKFAIAKRVR